MRHKKNITLNLRSITSHFTGKAKIITLCFINLILSFTNIILCFSNDFVSALSYQTPVNVSFTFNPTISISMSNDLTIPNLAPGTISDSNEINVNVSTNNVYGYNLYATVGNNTYDNTNLTDANNNTNYTFTAISPTANLPSLDIENTWGYSYSLDNGSTWSNYNGLALYSSDTPTRLNKTTEPSSDTINFKIAAKSSPTQASGEYSNVINFTAITKLAPLTLSESYEAYYIKEGKTKLNGYYVMQDMNKEICENAEVADSELQVIDNRDNKVYWIAKLRDDHCWMTQNLDLDLISDPQADNYVALTSENTDLNEYGQHNYTEQFGYSIDENDTITWLPANTTTNFEGSSMGNWISSAYAPSSANKTDDTNIGHDIYGNWYNWPAAIASNDARPFGTSTYDNPENNPINSICPKGWRLPIITNYSTDQPGNNDFNNLNYYYNNGSTTTNAGLRAAPLYFKYSSTAPNLLYMNDMMLYQSSTITISYNSAYTMNMISSWGEAPSYRTLAKDLGSSLRCLAR